MPTNRRSEWPRNCCSYNSKSNILGLMILVLSGLHCLPVDFFLHLFWIFYIQFFISFLGIFFARLLHGIICSLNAVGILKLFAVLQICYNIFWVYIAAEVTFMVSWLVGFYFWLRLKTLFMKFSGYPFPDTVIKVTSCLFKVSSFVHIAVPSVL
jgi:hypothetical protein